MEQTFTYKFLVFMITSFELNAVISRIMAKMPNIAKQ